jgi:hypothetical protein
VLSVTVPDPAEATAGLAERIGRVEQACANFIARVEAQSR